MFQETGAVTRFPSAVMPERPQPAERDERTSPAEIVAVLWRRRLWIALGRSPDCSQRSHSSCW